MKSFWQNDAIVWSEGIKQMDLVVKDGSGAAVTRTNALTRKSFSPTKVRITLIQVSAGSKYDPSLAPGLSRKSGVEARKKSATETDPQ